MNPFRFIFDTHILPFDKEDEAAQDLNEQGKGISQFRVSRNEVSNVEGLSKRIVHKLHELLHFW